MFRNFQEEQRYNFYVLVYGAYIF